MAEPGELPVTREEAIAMAGEIMDEERGEAAPNAEPGIVSDMSASPVEPRMVPDMPASLVEPCTVSDVSASPAEPAVVTPRWPMPTRPARPAAPLRTRGPRPWAVRIASAGNAGTALASRLLTPQIVALS